MRSSGARRAISEFSESAKLSIIPFATAFLKARLMREHLFLAPPK
jgi:hypothetical protein